jgi:3-oxoacyl-[acyl-carrier protein] reductase
MGMANTPENRAKFVGNIPLGRLATPLDIAKAALYLASDMSDFITGIELPVDGGRAI